MGQPSFHDARGRLTFRAMEIMRMSVNGTRPSDAAMQVMLRGYDRWWFERRFGAMLLGIRAQLELLRDFNRAFWQHWLSPSDLDSVDTTSCHGQCVDDLEVLYVDFGSPERTVEYWWHVIAGSHTHTKAWYEMSNRKFRLRDCARSYGPGIHRVHVNLVAHWNPGTATTVEDMVQGVKASGEVLAHCEALAIYAYHCQLLKQMDGVNLPFAELAGLETQAPSGGVWGYTPSLQRNRDARETKLESRWNSESTSRSAVPVIIR